MEVERVIELLDDNYCSGAPLAGYTSCMDNLVEMLKKHVTGEGEGPMAEIRKAAKSWSSKGCFCWTCLYRLRTLSSCIIIRKLFKLGGL